MGFRYAAHNEPSQLLHPHSAAVSIHLLALVMPRAGLFSLFL
ncbi:MAG: hypothetical protein ACPL7A_01110 [Anaerolineales bacterium]